MATSPARIAANRTNALKSTGPRTPEGKQNSSLNSLKHGLTAHTLVLPHEDATAFAAFVESFHMDLAPSGAIETALVQTLAETKWRLNRFQVHETNLFALAELTANHAVYHEDPAIDAALTQAAIYRDEIDTLNKASLYENRHSRIFSNTLKQLLALQAARKTQEQEELHLAAATCKQYKTKNLAFQPADFGFVCSIPQIERHLRRQEAVSALPVLQITTRRRAA